MNKDKRLANYALVVFVGLSVFLLILPVGRFVHSVRVFLGYGLYQTLDYGAQSDYYLRGVPGNFLRILQTDQENLLLRRQIKDFQIAVAKGEADAEENRRLRQLTGLSGGIQWKGAWARVIERDPSHWYSAFLVDKGSVEGITVNSPVLGVVGGKVGLVGRVIEVSHKTSKVLLITDDLSSVVCYVRGGQWEGLAEGRGAGALKLSYMPLEAEVVSGAELLTSPSSTVFPAGISIGRISKFYPKESFMTFLSAEVIPTVAPTATKEVYIIGNSQRGGVSSTAGEGK